MQYGPVQGINLAVESLATALRRVRSEVGAPHAALRTQTAQLCNLHSTLDLLRHLIHRLKLVAKLRVRTKLQPICYAPQVLSTAYVQAKCTAMSLFN